MPRPLSTPATSGAFALRTGEVYAVLLTIVFTPTGAGETTIRATSNAEPITSNSNLFKHYPFKTVFPEEAEGKDQKLRLRIENVDQVIISGDGAGGGLRSVTEPPEVTAQVVCVSSPNTIEEEYTNIKLRKMTFNETVIEGELTGESLNEKFPWIVMDPQSVPGLFGLPSGSYGD